MTLRLLTPCGWVEFATYHLGGVAILLREHPTVHSEVNAKATVLLDSLGCELGENEVWIKTWAENEGVLEGLVAGGVVDPTGRVHVIGRNGSQVCAVHARLTPMALVELARQQGGIP